MWWAFAGVVADAHARHDGDMEAADPTASFRADGGDVGVLLCHGFTGTPASLLPWAKALAAAGYSVRLPLLPGHGGDVAAANRSSWTDWFDRVDQEFLALAATCRQVVVIGLSMGGALALRLAEVHDVAPGPSVAGLILVNPSVRLSTRERWLLPVLRRLASSARAIGNDIAMESQDEYGLPRTPLHAAASMARLHTVVAADLRRVRAPMLMYTSATDHVVGPESAKLIAERVGSTEVERVVLHRSYHVATLDHDAPLIVEGSLAFLQAHTGAGASRPTVTS